MWPVREAVVGGGTLTMVGTLAVGGVLTMVATLAVGGATTATETLVAGGGLITAEMLPLWAVLGGAGAGYCLWEERLSLVLS